MKKGIYLLLLLSISVHFLANAQDNAGLTLPTGFKANLFAENIGSARHIAISKNGVVFAKLNRADKQGRTIIRLADENKDGVSDNVTGWANYGGTGIYLTGNALYASSNEAVFKYQLDGKDEVLNPLSPITVVSGLISRRQHESKSITFDKANNTF
jgi:hypothetical protein